MRRFGFLPTAAQRCTRTGHRPLQLAASRHIKGRSVRWS